jgi:hypothetical protein
MSHRLKSLFICEAVALLVWLVIPGTAIDRFFFSMTAKSFAASDHFISGKGKDKKPFTLHTLRNSPPDITGNLPADIVIGDDPEKVFQTSPPSPVDFAVILKNLRRMGRDSVAIGMPLSWTDPDVLSLVALDQQLDAFPSAITSAPLSRSAAPTPIPQAFRRASVPLFRIKGDTSLLPVVNRVPIPDVVLGNKTSLAGFTTIESEESTELPYLLARWEDRAVFSFHLLATLGHYHLQPHSTTVRLGEWISLGPDGPFIPIDQYGRLTFKPPVLPDSSMSPIPAESLIDAPDGFLADTPADPVLIRNGLSAADPVSMMFSGSLVATVGMLSDPGGTSQSRSFPSPPWYAELLMIASVLSLIYGFTNYPFLRGKRPLAILAGALFLLHFLLVPATSIWIPTLPLIACSLAAIPFAALPDPKKTKPGPAKRDIPEKPDAKAAKKTARKGRAKKSPPKRKYR